MQIYTLLPITSPCDSYTQHLISLIFCLEEPNQEKILSATTSIRILIIIIKIAWNKFKQMILDQRIQIKHQATEFSRSPELDTGGGNLETMLIDLKEKMTTQIPPLN